MGRSSPPQDFEICKALHDLESNKIQLDSVAVSSSLRLFDSPFLELALSIFEPARRRRRENRTFRAGNLNYALTRIIQIVPKKPVTQSKLETEFSYWLYAVTADAPARTALLVQTYPSFEDERLGIAIAGVIIDMKDEYKRRINAPYEEQQILLNGDCYDVVYSKRSTSLKS